jgi:hypothetical protein
MMTRSINRDCFTANFTETEGCGVGVIPTEETFGLAILDA